MVDWIIIIVALAPTVALLYFLERKGAPKWQVWAVWICGTALLVGALGAYLFSFETGYVAASVLLGAACGAVGGFTMEPPFSIGKGRRRA